MHPHIREYVSACKDNKCNFRVILHLNAYRLLKYNTSTLCYEKDNTHQN